MSDTPNNPNANGAWEDLERARLAEQAEKETRLRQLRHARIKGIEGLADEQSDLFATGAKWGIGGLLLGALLGFWR